MDDLPIGRYGTIHYMSNNGSEVPLASYPVDEPIINLGRSDHNSCHIRLFDRWCSDIHCKLIFDEGKALLVVLGDNGAIIDGSEFFPSSNEASPTTVPLTNGSEWLIYKRRFIFQYPPKDQRAKLLATPKKSRKSLRMSMINAAQLWTPSASASGPKSQAESWRRLQSPVQPFPDGDGAAITVVEGDPVHLSHNQEEVIVVESVDSPEVPEPEVAPPASTRKTASTPSKRGPANLHKQVLLMNSHRKHTKSLDELEEREVEESILVEDNSDDDLEEDADANPFIEREVPIKAEEPEINLDEKSLTPRTFRASLGAIGSVLPFGRPSGVIHSPAPPGEGEEHEADQEMELEELSEHSSTPANKRTLGAFFTPQVQRGEYRSHPRQSVGSGSAGYVDLDNDIEQARRRLASLATVERPQIVDVSADAPSRSRPVPSSAKKARPSLADVPELSSPMPTTKGSYGMTTISEGAVGMAEEDGEEADQTANRLQRLMRTVEKETRRESIREARMSTANPVDFYSAPGSSPIKAGTTYDERPLPALASKSIPTSQRVTQPKTEIQISKDDESDTSAKDSEIPATKPRRGAKGVVKHPAPVTGKRAGRSVERSEDQMQVDEPDATATSEDVTMESVEEPPAKKPRTTRKAKAPTQETTAPARARRIKKVETVDDENADEESPATEDNTSLSVASRSRRGLRAESVTSDAPPAKATTSTSTRRGARTKAQAVAVALDSVEDEHSGSSASGVPEPVPIAKKGKRGQAAKVVNEVAHEDDDEEADVSAAPAKPARRAARGKAAAAPSVEPAEMESEQASEDASVEVPKGKATAKKTSTRTKKTAAKKEDTSVEPEPAVPEKKPAARSTRKAVVKEEPEEDANVETKPRRTARTKR